MPLHKRTIPADDDSISLVTTLLVRYPELCTIKYSPKGHLLRLSFILKMELDRRKREKIREDLLNCVSAYMYYESKQHPGYFKINFHHAPGLTQVEITRDTQSLSQREISLIVGFLHQQFQSLLVREDFQIPEDEISQQDDTICYMLDSLREKNPKNKVTAVREEGRVLIFQR